MTAMHSDHRVDLPQVRGRYLFDQALSDLTWFRVGGTAEVIFVPADADDLMHFLQARPSDVPLTILGAGSNTLVRDGGVPGVTIRLGKAFASISLRENDAVYAGAAALDVAVARYCAEQSRAGLAFFRGIPGTIGGALAMNAGAYGFETCDRLIYAEAVTIEGQLLRLTADDLGMSYRQNRRASDLIFIGALFATEAGDRAIIEQHMAEISAQRETSQPIKSRTGGSTFKNPGGANPEGPKAWKLIDAAGCRGLRRGNAEVSQQHCNFLINHGGASAADIEALGEAVRAAVKESSGIDLSWEIKRVGVPA